MVDERQQEWKLLPFERWVQSENLQVITTHTVPDIFTEPLEEWKRIGCKGALLDLTHDPVKDRMVNNQGSIRYLVEIPPGGTFKAERHMYEEIFYVVAGRGAATIWYDGSPKQTFEWHEDSVFSIPLNAWHEIYNASGTEPVRLYAATNMPTIFNLFGNPDFVFNCTNAFPERFDPTDEMYFSGKTKRLADRLMETNFIPSITSFTLDRWVARGPGTNMFVLMAGGRLICHLSEFPAASYKKGHNFGADSEARTPQGGQLTDTSYLFLSGEGYDLQWAPGAVPGPGVDFTRIPFKRGSLMSNGHGGHQHFNPSGEPARYLVFRSGNPAFSGRGVRAGDGSAQIEFKDQDPRIDELFAQECAKHGTTPQMPAD